MADFLPVPDLAVVNEALVRLGEPPLESLDEAEQTAAATAARYLYQPTVDRLLASHPWGFNRQFAVLVRLADVPALGIGFRNAFLLPGGVLRIVAPFVGGYPEPEWSRGGDVLYLDAPALDQPVELEYHGRVDPAFWTPAFREAAGIALAASWAVTISDDVARAKTLQEQAEFALARARHASALEHPIQALPVGRLAARMRRW